MLSKVFLVPPSSQQPPLKLNNRYAFLLLENSSAVVLYTVLLIYWNHHLHFCTTFIWAGAVIQESIKLQAPLQTADTQSRRKAAMEALAGVAVA